MTPLTVLDELGIQRITDKSSLDHDYLTKYERLFTPYRDMPIVLLEIGVFDGGSLRLWEDYFPRATVVGLDIRVACKQHEGGRRIVEIASQADAKMMTAISQKYRPAIVIDDGSHQADHIIISFESIYPTLSDGGIYIVEDLGMHTGPDAAVKRGSSAISPQAYFLRLANRVVCPGEDVDVDPRIFTATESVEFMQNLAVIRKRASRDPDAIAKRRAVIDKFDCHRTWGWFSRYIINHGGSKDEAVECARRAVSLAPLEVGHCAQLARALEAAGRLDEALEAAKEAQRRAPNIRGFADTVSRLARKVADQRQVL